MPRGLYPRGKSKKSVRAGKGSGAYEESIRRLIEAAKAVGEAQARLVIVEHEKQLVESLQGKA